MKFYFPSILFAYMWWTGQANVEDEEQQNRAMDRLDVLWKSIDMALDEHSSEGDAQEVVGSLLKEYGISGVNGDTKSLQSFKHPVYTRIMNDAEYTTIGFDQNGNIDDYVYDIDDARWYRSDAYDGLEEILAETVQEPNGGRSICFKDLKRKWRKKRATPAIKPQVTPVTEPPARRICAQAIHSILSRWSQVQ